MDLWYVEGLGVTQTGRADRDISPLRIIVMYTRRGILSALDGPSVRWRLLASLEVASMWLEEWVESGLESERERFVASHEAVAECLDEGWIRDYTLSGADNGRVQIRRMR